MQSGLVVVDKPAGWTSHDVVAKLRGVYGQKRIGHAGTLDPDATGVLLVGLGRVTRLLRFLQETEKEYRGEVVFGIATTSLDAAGDVVEERPMPLTLDAVASAATRLVGDIEQVPPMVSAVKVGGRRLHELARAGTEVERAARPVHIARIDVEAFAPGEHPRATIHVVCSSGTYIRTLAADIGALLGGPAHLGSLRRLRVGAFSDVDALSLDVVVNEPGAAVRTPADAMRHLPTLVVDAATAEQVAHGSPLPGASSASDGPVAVLDEIGELLAVYSRTGASLRPLVVLSGGA